MSDTEPYSDTEEQPQTKQRRPQAQRSDSDQEDGNNRSSRSQSRRARRKKASQQNGKRMAPVEEQQEPQAQQNGAQAQAAAKSPNGEAGSESWAPMQPFEWIGPDETSMNGPVTYARAMRGEIPMRPGKPNQQLATGPDGKGQDSDLMDQDGLKLRIELNLDIEIELKATIHGDVTLALLA